MGDTKIVIRLSKVSQKPGEFTKLSNARLRGVYRMDYILAFPGSLRTQACLEPRTAARFRQQRMILQEKLN